MATNKSFRSISVEGSLMNDRCSALYSDLYCDDINKEYKFKHIKVTRRCHDLIKKMIDSNKTKCDIWLYDAEQKRIEDSLDPGEIAMIDGVFTWGYNDWEEEDFGTSNQEPCLYPQDHNFEKKAWTTFFFRECKKCGYAPHFDSNKPKYEKCHREFKEWEKK